MYPFYSSYPQYPVMQDQRPYQQPLNQAMQPSVVQTPAADERIFVQGEEAAKAYLVAPNSFVRLWDSQDNVFYEKRTDQSGRPYMERYRYERQDNPMPKAKDTEIYDEKLESLEKRILALEKKGRKKDAEHESNADDTGV